MSRIQPLVKIVDSTDLGAVQTLCLQRMLEEMTPG